MMKFDGNLVWKQATATMAVHRDLVLALAGVFFFLPSFALIMLIKQPQMAPGGTPEQMMKVLEPFFASAAPWFLLASIIQSVGQVTLLQLFGSAGRSTVGQALRAGLSALPTYIAMQLITGFLMTMVLFLVVGIASLISPVLGVALGIYAACQAFGRFVAGGAVVVLEREKNPFAALLEAVALSRGNGFRIGNFLFLLATATFFLLMVLTFLVGIAAALALGEGRTADIVAGFFSSVATAVAVSYFAAIIVAIYRQLRGNSPEQAGRPFD
ncbi:hypothetical protein KRR38_23560 [Novosphingobium sp. G106]|uniref:hypothetical protein n=1 Tax=Novosphingobium sp. G106 TaxID=2849500 RepID=UPI001C2DE623|nr:hypothetical protein [Novosphingobium sp. G106]MBV1690571.1 hypothetical protein [Novosphingobium sp. G106]